MKIQVSLSFIIIFTFFTFCSATNLQIDSLKTVLSKAKDDTSKVNTLLTLSKKYNAPSIENSFRIEPEEEIQYAKQALDLSVKLNYKKGKGMALFRMGNGSFNIQKYRDAFDYWNQSLEILDSIGDKDRVIDILSGIGFIYFQSTDYEKALEYFIRSLNIAKDERDTSNIALISEHIGNVYGEMRKNREALDQYKEALSLSVILRDSDLIESITYDIGNLYLKNEKNDSALFYFRKILDISKEIEMVTSVKIKLANVYSKEGDYISAIKYFRQAIDSVKKYEWAESEISESLLGLGAIYEKQGQRDLAIVSLKQAENLAKRWEPKDNLKEIYTCLINIYSRENDLFNELKYQKLLTNLKDTLLKSESNRKIVGMEFRYETEKLLQSKLLEKENGIQDAKYQRQILLRNSFFGGFAVVLLFAGIFFSQRNKISKEKKRSDELLLNILPSETAEELKRTGASEAKSYDEVTVMFTDFKNFTQLSESMSAKELVKEINYCYTEFDRIISKYKIEKIKTIGDCYMAAGGLPIENMTNPEDTVNAAVEIQHFMLHLKEQRLKEGKSYFEIRIGIHSGPVVAGIVGIKKFAYDIWGDTVNIASRMESSGEAGKVNISGSTYKLVKEKFICTHRGKILAKNKGEIDMYFVDGIS